MKNRKLFKTLSISATSLAVAATAISVPLVVMAKNGLLGPHKKDGQSNDNYVKNAQGDVITTEQIIYAHSKIFFSFWQGGSAATAKQLIVNGDWSFQPSEDIADLVNVTPTINPESSPERVGSNLENGIWVEAKDITGLRTGGKIVVNDAAGTKVAELSVALSPTPETTEKPTTHIKWEGATRPDDPVALKPGSTTYFDIVDEDGNGIEANSTDIFIGSLKGNRIKSITPDGTIKYRYNVSVGDTVGDDRILVMLSDGYLPAETTPVIGTVETQFIGGVTSTVHMSSKGKTGFALYNQVTQEPLKNCTFTKLLDPSNVFDDDENGAVIRTSNFYKVSAKEYTGDELTYATYIVSCPNYGSLQVDIAVDNQDSYYCEPMFIETTPNKTATEQVELLKASDGSHVDPTEFEGSPQSFTPSIVGEAGAQKVQITAGSSITRVPETLGIANEDGCGYVTVAINYADSLGAYDDKGNVKTSMTLFSGASDSIVIKDATTGLPLAAGAVKATVEGSKTGGIIDDPTELADGKWSIHATAPGVATVVFEADNYNPIRVRVTATEGEDFSMEAPKTTPSGKVNTTASFYFTPKNSEMASKITTLAVANDWYAEADFPTQKIELVAENPGTSSAKIKVNVKTHESDPGAGVISLHYKGSETSPGEKGRTPFYVYEHTIAITNAPTEAVNIGQTPVTLKATSDGTDPESGDIIWTSSNPKICEVNETTGALAYHGTAEKTNPVVIRASHKSDPWSFAETNITINKPTLQLKIGSDDKTDKTIQDKVSSESTTTKQLDLYNTDVSTSAKINSDSHVTWKTSNPEVATVNASGLVTYEDVGTTTITATYTSDSGEEFWIATVKFELSAHVYKFSNVDETGTIGWEGHENLDLYKSGIYAATPKQVSVTRDGTSYTSLSNIAWKAELFENGSIVTGTAPIDIDASTGEITYNATTAVGKTALITGEPLDTKAAPFYVAYTITDSTFEITGWDASQEHHISDEGKTLSVTLDGEPISEDYDVEWNSSKESVAKVDDDGKLTYYSEGDTTITAEIYVDETKLTEVSVDISIAGDKIIPFQETMDLLVGKTKTQTITVNGVAAPAGSTTTYSVDDSSIASVTSTGQVTGLKEGTTTMHIAYVARTDAPAQPAEATINVSIAGILLNYTWVEGTAGHKSVRLKAYDGNTVIDYKNLSFTSRDETICEVDNTEDLNKKGQLTLKKEGKTTIDVDYKGVTTVTRSCEVTVHKNSFVLSSSELNVSTADPGATLKGFFDGKAVASENITWASSKEDVCTVVGGVLTYVAAGSASIIASYTPQGSETKLYATCNVNIKKADLTFNVVDTIKGVTTAGKNTKQIKCFLNGVETAIVDGKIAGKAITFTSTDTNIFTVGTGTTNPGLITFVAAGDATLKIECELLGSEPLEITVHVIR